VSRYVHDAEDQVAAALASKRPAAQVVAQWLADDWPVETILEACFGRPISPAYLEACGAEVVDQSEGWRLLRARGGHAALVAPAGALSWVAPWLDRCAAAREWAARHAAQALSWASAPGAAPGLPLGEERARRGALRLADLQARQFVVAPSPRAEVETALRKLYAMADRAAPPILWVDGPIQAAIIDAVLTLVAGVDTITSHVTVAMETPDSRLVAAVKGRVPCGAMPPGLWQTLERQVSEEQREQLVQQGLHAGLSALSLELGDQFRWHHDTVVLRGEVRDQLLQLAARLWPGSAASISDRLPVADTPLGCEELKCPGANSGWQGGLRPNWSLCDRGCQACEALSGLFWPHDDFAQADVFRAIGVQLHPVHDELVDAGLLLTGCSALITRPGLAICCERALKAESAVMVFADHTRIHLDEAQPK
jgi:hypothetical protein